MNDMEKCFYEPAELSVVDEGKGCSLVKAKGSPYKLGFLVAQGADGIFKSLNDAEAVDAMERAIVGTIRIMAQRRKAEFGNRNGAFDMSSGFNAVRDEGALKEILKGMRSTAVSKSTPSSLYLILLGSWMKSPGIRLSSIARRYWCLQGRVWLPQTQPFGTSRVTT